VQVVNQEVDLTAFLDDLRSSYELPSGKEITFNWDYPSDLPTVTTDAEKLKHILQNLINNAIKFTEKGSITVSARPSRGDGAIEFRVTDTGIGIPRDALPIIFDIFRQVDSSETRAYGGVGLGLYIVKKYTELLGGVVDVTSQLGKGSTFSIKLSLDGSLWRYGSWPLDHHGFF